MPKFNPGDTVKINGVTMTVDSWPESDEGPFTAHYTLNGGLIYGTYWAGPTQSVESVQNDADTVAGGGPGQPVQETASVELVAQGSGVQSTLGDNLPAAEDELTEQADANNVPSVDPEDEG